MYGNQARVGEGLRDFIAGGGREELFVTSQGWNDDHRPEAVRASALKSISELGCAYLDLLLVHWPHAWVPGGAEGEADGAVTLAQTWCAPRRRGGGQGGGGGFRDGCLLGSGRVDVGCFVFWRARRADGGGGGGSEGSKRSGCLSWAYLAMPPASAADARAAAPPRCPPPPCRQAMEALVEEGLVRHLGLSNFGLKGVEEVLGTAKVPPVVLQVELHPLLAQRKLVGVCLRKVGVWVCECVVVVVGVGVAAGAVGRGRLVRALGVVGAHTSVREVGERVIGGLFRHRTRRSLALLPAVARCCS